MTLRRRLTLLVALAVIVPLAAAGVTMVNVVGRQTEERAAERARLSASFAVASLTARQAALDAQAVALAASAEDPASITIPPPGADRVEVLPAGEVKSVGDELVGEAIAESGETIRVIVALDEDTLAELPRPEGVSFDVARRAFARDVHEDGFYRSGAVIPDSGLALIASVADPERDAGVVLGLAAFIALMVLLIALIGYVVSGLVTRPVDDLVAAADAISKGDFDQQVAIQGDVEIASLGRAFNDMTANLREHIQQLEQSRRGFRHAIARLGDVLVSTHDLGGIIDVVLDACALTVDAREAVYYERVAMPARIRATAARGRDIDDYELNATGVAGRAARELTAVRHPPADLDPAEPHADSAVAAPVTYEGRLVGVLAVYGKQDGTFDDDDVDTLLTLARQAEVAIGNALLYDERQRQARTDGLTGLWNRREFELRCREAIREASRFDEPFGLIVCDIDDFKQVNDRYDHSTGDAALVWIAARLSEAVREIDLVARWGGEEFIVLLPRAGAEETALVAERIRYAVNRRPMEDGSRVIPLSVSVGYAVHPFDGSTAQDLFKAADGALLRAKRLGKNRVERAGAEDGAQEHEAQEEGEGAA